MTASVLKNKQKTNKQKNYKIWRFCLILIYSILSFEPFMYQEHGKHIKHRRKLNDSDTAKSQTMNLQRHSKHHSKLTLNVIGKKKERKENKMQ